MVRRFQIIRLSCALAYLLTSACAHAQAVSPRGDAYGDAFLNYQPYVTPAAPASAPAPVAAAPARPAQVPASAPVAEGKQAVTVEFLRKIYPQLEERAINNPTD